MREIIWNELPPSYFKVVTTFLQNMRYKVVVAPTNVERKYRYLRGIYIYIMLMYLILK